MSTNKDFIRLCSGTLVLTYRLTYLQTGQQIKKDPMQGSQLDFKEAENILKADTNHRSLCGQLPWSLGTSGKLDARENSKQTRKNEQQQKMGGQGYTNSSYHST